MSIVLGVGGYAKAGKDTFVNALAADGWNRTYMSEPLERSLVTLNPIVDSWVEWAFGEPFVKVKRFKELRDEVGYDEAKNNEEFRRLLIAMGTEVGREQFDPDLWMKIAEKTIQKSLESRRLIAVTGIRFLNELDMISAYHGITVWIERPGVGPVANHASENTLGPDDMDYVVVNDGSVRDLHEKARKLVAGL